MNKKSFHFFSLIASTALLVLIGTHFIKKPQILRPQAKTEHTCWIAWGPPGTPDESWDTAKEVLQNFLDNNIAATEIDRWVNGGWDSHLYNFTFNNFTIEAGQGYFIKKTDKSMKDPNSYLTYTPLSEITYNINAGWSLISIPEGLLESFGSKKNKTTGEDLCQSVNNQGGTALEVLSTPVCSNSKDQEFWNVFKCGVNAKDLTLQTGKSYFIKANTYSTWTLTK